MSNSEKSLFFACCIRIYQFFNHRNPKIKNYSWRFAGKTIYGMIAIVGAEYQNTYLYIIIFATCPCPIGCPGPVPGGAIGQSLV